METHHPPRILLLLYDPGFANGLYELLELFDYDVRRCKLPTSAFEQLETWYPEWYPDLFIIEAEIPELYGTTFYEQITAVPSFASIPVIFLTWDPSRLEVFEKFKPLAVFGSPAEFDRLRAVIQKAVGENQ